MRKLLNILYVSSQGSYLRIEGETVVIEREKEKVLQIPLHTIQGIVCFGNVLCSPFLLGGCSKKGISVSFLTEYGRFLASVHGPTSGNVFLRREQYRMADEPTKCQKIASNVISGKLVNSRVVISRAIRDHENKIDVDSLRRVLKKIASILCKIEKSADVGMLRGLEGLAGAEYFSVFNHLVIDQKDDFVFKERNRRPPLDNINAMLSFTYTLLAHDVRSALETVGLDPAVGFLHRDRPGRPSLALDIMEEFRPVIADRLVLSLINRRQVNKKGFTQSTGGAVVMDSDTRKTLLVEYHKRKQEQIYHPFLEEKVQIGLLFFVQSNLLARYIRGDIDGYPPFFWR
ncbi:MAG TPA: type I-C CRISPR-associated endonuclease Cas1c [Treponemataceae bacterium]|nr:type I-C CRISPR-associated endonuclease Cas1c [Treponemataceae bacterium]